ncbi:hypothetical protein IW262DRAFT_1469175 [Armillaria fumosa]|nr:hypothetical protein IW262DRAFT_1469175 [Armillaria fumosa]
MDHQALEFFKMQMHLIGCQMRWMDYLSRFDFDITYIKGENNKVADCLSHYYENDTWDDTHGVDEYVHADTCIDPSRDDLPPSWLQEVSENIIEICAMQDMTCRYSHHLQERRELRDIKAMEMADAAKAEWPNPSVSHASTDTQADYTLADALQSGLDLVQTHKDDDAYAEAVQESYTNDLFFKLILDDPNVNQSFSVRNGMIWMRNGNEEEVLCIPKRLYNGHSLQEIVLDQRHEVLGHYGYQ